ncbi:MAG: hypothetical protein ABSD78_12875, partial [Acidimicrobiales bacterium]
MTLDDQPGLRSSASAHAELAQGLARLESTLAGLERDASGVGGDLESKIAALRSELQTVAS